MDVSWNSNIVYRAFPDCLFRRFCSSKIYIRTEATKISRQIKNIRAIHILLIPYFKLDMNYCKMGNITIGKCHFNVNIEMKLK